MDEELESCAAGTKLAEQHMSSMGARWMHVKAVAARAGVLVTAVPPADQSLLVAAAWLHDIGYAPDLALTGFHPLDGARYLASQGVSTRLLSLVAHHSGARYEAEIRGMKKELAEYHFEDSAVMDALVCADMTTGPSGESLAFDQRIAEILSRYERRSPVHQAIRCAEPYLSGAVTRTLGRLDSLTRRLLAA